MCNDPTTTIPWTDQIVLIMLFNILRLAIWLWGVKYILSSCQESPSHPFSRQNKSTQAEASKIHTNGRGETNRAENRTIATANKATQHRATSANRESSAEAESLRSVPLKLQRWSSKDGLHETVREKSKKLAPSPSRASKIPIFVPNLLASSLVHVESESLVDPVAAVTSKNLLYAIANDTYFLNESAIGSDSSVATAQVSCLQNDTLDNTSSLDLISFEEQSFLPEEKSVSRKISLTSPVSTPTNDEKAVFDKKTGKVMACSFGVFDAPKRSRPPARFSAVRSRNLSPPKGKKSVKAT